MAEQPNLLEIPEQPLLEKPAPAPIVPKLRTVDRAQSMAVQICVEELIPADHTARAIWELAGRLDLDRFAESVKTQVGGAGRPAWDPRLIL